MDASVLDGLLQRHKQLDSFLRANAELSLAIEAELLFKRAFVVACGCYCEESLVDVLHRFAASAGDQRLSAFVKNRALERRYHDLFEWSAANANKFWSCFGEAFKESALSRLRADEAAARSVRGFMTLGRLRNSVAHRFATVSVDQTLDELELLFREATSFLHLVEDLLAPS